jgi:hypothetical protein
VVGAVRRQIEGGGHIGLHMGGLNRVSLAVVG